MKIASCTQRSIAAALAGGERSILEIVMATHAGMTTDEFDKVVKDWVATARHPKTKRLYTELDKALDEANAKGWTVVDMKNDWNRIFPFEKH